MLVNRYLREDMLDDLLDATKTHTGAREPVMWVCDCGCDIAQWYRRTDAGLAFTQQAWPPGRTPIVVIMETRSDVEKFVTKAVEGIRRNGSTEAIEARAKSFEKAVWAAWAES